MGVIHPLYPTNQDPTLRDIQHSILGLHSGTPYYVDTSTGDNDDDGLTPATAKATFSGSTGAIATASAGDTIIAAPGAYDEAVSITKSLTIIGTGGRGAAYIAPTAANSTGVLVTANDVTLINVGCDGDGTGPGLHVQGDVARFRAIECKIEGDDYGCRLESTAAGAVADSRFEDCEFAWASTAFHFKVSGAGNAVTETYIGHSLFHNYATVGIHAETVETADVWIDHCLFQNLDSATEPTDYLLLDVANTTGMVSNSTFATSAISAAKMTIAAGVLWVANYAEDGLSAARPA